MSEQERRTIEQYVLEVFHYEHQCSSEILARIMLLCELLIEKNIVTSEEVMDKLSIVNVAKMMDDLNYGDDTWNEEDIHNATN